MSIKTWQTCLKNQRVRFVLKFILQATYWLMWTVGWICLAYITVRSDQADIARAVSVVSLLSAAMLYVLQLGRIFRYRDFAGTVVSVRHGEQLVRRTDTATGLSFGSISPNHSEWRRTDALVVTIKRDTRRGFGGKREFVFPEKTVARAEEYYRVGDRVTFLRGTKYPLRPTADLPFCAFCGGGPIRRGETVCADCGQALFAEAADPPNSVARDGKG